MFGRTGPSANTSSFTPQPLRKKTKDARDREGYVFHVDEFALGNLDGNKKKFYTVGLGLGSSIELSRI